jgi:hypothetical protein
MATKQLNNMINMIPIIIPTALLFTSIMDASLKGFLYTFGAVFVVLFNNILSNLMPSDLKKPPGIIPSPGVPPAFDSNNNDCDNIFGIKQTFPDTISVFMAFTTGYVAVSPIFINPYITTNIGKSFWALTQLAFASIFFAIINVKISCCTQWISVFSGWLLGLIFGIIWYSVIGYISDYSSGYTYFENDNSKKCKINNNVYNCTT